MSDIRDPDLIREAARHNAGATILMTTGEYFDFLNPERTPVSIEDFAYSLAFTVRFRGFNRQRSTGRRVFYGVGEHCVRLALAMIAEGHSREDAFAGLMHEPGEVPFGDMPGPAKGLFPGFKAAEKGCGEAILANMGIAPARDPELIKRFDIRMYITERRDLTARPCAEVTPGYEPFAEEIFPYSHPEEAAHAFLTLFGELAPVDVADAQGIWRL